MSTERPSDSGIAAWAVFRPVATLMVVVAVAVFGYISYRQLPVSLMPELSYPTLTVRTELPGAAPQEVEENVTRRVEEIVRTVEGVIGLESTSRAGQSDVVLRFVWNTDMDFAMQKVRERVELVPFPDEAEMPLILRYDPALDPMMRLGLWGDEDLAELRRLAEDEVQRALEKVDGVAMIRVRGGEEEVIRVDLDPGRMAFLGVTTAEVAQRLASENVNVAGGALAEGDVTYLVRTLNAFSTIEEIAELIVAYPDGIPVRLHQIANVQRDIRDPEVITRMGDRDGVHDSVVIEVFKEADANLVEVSRRVHDALFGSPQAQSQEAVAMARDVGTRTAERAQRLATGAGGIAFGTPAARPEIVVQRLGDAQIALLSDQAVFIQNSIDEVVDTALWGGFFAVMVLLLFLRNVWTTVIIAIAIPLSVVGAFGALRLSGVSLNVMSLGGIALGVGMLVDNSIVVLESIIRCREEGDGPVQAALRGAREVAGAVIASTLTTVAVFFPIVFVEGIAGQIFGDLALAVVFALTASLVVAVFFVPMLASRPPLQLVGGREALALLRLTQPLSAWRSFHRDQTAWRATLAETSGVGKGWRVLLTPVVLVVLVAQLVALAAAELLTRVVTGVVGGVLSLAVLLARGAMKLAAVAVRPGLALFDLGWSALTAAYPRLLRAALAAPMLVVIAAVGAFAWSVWQFDEIGSELLPTMHQGEFTVRVEMPVGTRLQQTSDAVRRFESELTALDGIERFATTVGMESAEIQASDEGEYTARILVRLARMDDPEAAERRVMAAVREVGARLPGTTIEIARPTLFALQTPLEVRVFSDDLRLLAQASNAVEHRLQQIDSLADVRNNLGEGFPEVQVTFDRDRLAAFDLTAQRVGEAIRDQVRGVEPTDIYEEENAISILVRTDPRELPDVEALQGLIVRPRTADTAEIRLGGVAKLELAVGPSEIRRVEGRRAAVIEADVPLVSLSGAALEVEQALREVQLPGTVEAAVAGQNAEMERAMQSMLFALLLAVFLVYIVLASTFESFRGPFVILLSIPLALTGVVVALRAFDLHVSVLVFIGLIMLTGIVVNNAIVLVDYINQMRARGLALDDAIVEAAAVRLRPVLLTTLTTVLGLGPLALGLGEGAELRQPMGITVVAGILSATVLTLVVVPVLYRLLMGGVVRSEKIEGK